MKEYCEYWDDNPGTMPEPAIAACPFLPESCHCSDCQYYRIEGEEHWHVCFTQE